MFVGTTILSGCIALFSVTTLFFVLQGPTNPVLAGNATKFDEFSDVQESDLKARLDNFAIQLNQLPDAKGFVLVYRSKRDLPGLSYSLAWRSKDYLVSSRGLTKDRIVAVDAGVASCLTQELWIVPKGTAPIPRTDTRIGYFYYPDVAWKFFEFGYLPREWYRHFGVTKSRDVDEEYLEAFASEVKKKRSNIACIIAYAQYNPHAALVDYSGDHEPIADLRLDTPGTARRELLQHQSILMKTYRIPASRIRIIDGGYRKRRLVELWVVPDGEPLPVATPNSFPTARNKH